MSFYFHDSKTFISLHIVLIYAFMTFNICKTNFSAMFMSNKYIYCNSKCQDLKLFGWTYSVILEPSWNRSCFSFQIKICTLEGNLARLNYENLLENPLLKFSGRNQVTTLLQASQKSAWGRHLFQMFAPWPTKMKFQNRGTSTWPNKDDRKHPCNLTETVNITFLFFSKIDRKWWL